MTDLGQSACRHQWDLVWYGNWHKGEPRLRCRYCGRWQFELNVAEPTEVEELRAQVRSLKRSLANVDAAIWGFFQMRYDRPAQAESLLRSALPDDYTPYGARDG